VTWAGAAAVGIVVRFPDLALSAVPVYRRKNIDALTLAELES